MKIREVRVQHFRNFGAQLRTVKFYDEASGIVRPLTVLVGSNGSGKSTIFQLIEGLLSYAIEVVDDRPITHELRETGYAAVLLEFEEQAPPELRKAVWIALGRKDRAPADYRSLPNQIVHLEQRGGAGRPFDRKGPRAVLDRWVREMIQEAAPFRGGLLHFPHDRWIVHEHRGAIEPPPKMTRWLFRFEPDSGWSGSLSQLWVWQNYLDLEQAAKGRPNLTRFVDTIETILGPGRRIVIDHGFVLIERVQPRQRVALHQLPSGEQQILALFGEIVRWLRPGAVVLIDEVEISLHPAMQRTVLFHLRRLASQHDLQIIVTTHSMDIVSAVAPHEVVNLDDMVAEEQALRTATTAR